MADLFVDGNIAQTFGPQVAESYLCRLLQVYRRSPMIFRREWLGRDIWWIALVNFGIYI